MKRYQTGEIILVMMVVMLVFVWLGSSHMGMGHTDQQAKTAQPAPAPKESPEHWH